MSISDAEAPARRGGRLLIVGWIVTILPFVVILAGLAAGEVANDLASRPVYWPLAFLAIGIFGASVTGLVALGLGIAAIVRGRRIAGGALAVVALVEAALSAVFWVRMF
ncbi:hypothetical protein [Microbacterium sp. 18062]|uniref:hypothetical protein n=1 Tax=Microbacterium sp. 18062 TaxID=2681410 RepID=UPI00135BF63E|nr:hypothetical protein [Microbacterium sp. 18062]